MIYKKLSCILIFLLVLIGNLASNPFMRLEPVYAVADEQIVNGSFETGTFAGWTVGSPSPYISTAQKHSGSYSAMGNNTVNSGYIYQDLLHNVTVASLTSCGFWGYLTDNDYADLEWLIYFTDSTTTGGVFSAGISHNTWTYENITSFLSGDMGKTIYRFYVAFFISPFFGHSSYIDDISIFGEAPPSQVSTATTVSPAIVGSVKFSIDSAAHSTPYTANVTVAVHTFLALNTTIAINFSYSYHFDHWLVNGSTSYGSASLVLLIGGATTFAIHYLGSFHYVPVPIIIDRAAVNATWFLRSDTHTVQSIFGFRLGIPQTTYALYDVKGSSTSQNAYVGVRVWALGYSGSAYELTSGSPFTIAILNSTSAGYYSTNWLCPQYYALVYAILVREYFRYESASWELRRWWITPNNLLIKLPSSTWTFTVYVNFTKGTPSSAAFWYGSSAKNSHIDLQYKSASPWEVAYSRILERQFYYALVTPWTYYLGDFFYGIIALMLVTLSYLRYNSWKPVLAILWIFGGAGSIVWAMIPAAALHIAVVLMAVAMAASLFRIIYR